MKESLAFDFDSATSTKAAIAALTRRGLHIVRSFDLRSALAAHGGCECPYHGTARCNCQFVVLLVYGDAREPVVLTTHGRENQTEVRIVYDATALPEPRLVEAVMAARAEAAITLQAVTTPTQDVAANAG